MVLRPLDEGNSSIVPPGRGGAPEGSPLGVQAPRTGCGSPAQGILPYGQTTVYGKSSKAWESGDFADFSLVKSGDSHTNCGQIFAVGCLNVEAHEGMNLDGVDMSGKAVIKYVRTSCKRPLCPICWLDWANRECDVANKRLDAFILKNRGGKALKPIHVIVSVPHEDYGLSFPNMRKKVYRALKRVGLLGGMMIYHPKRKNKAKVWYFSPHFHILGYGWLQNIRQNYVHSGYVVKNIGVRKSVRGTIFYQLSHMGISPKFRTITWFGMLAYNRLKVPKIKKEAQICPLCGNRLRMLIWIGTHETFLEHVSRVTEHADGGALFESDLNYAYKPKEQFDADYDVLLGKI